MPALRVTRDLERLRNYLLHHLLGLGLAVEQLVELDRTAATVEGPAVRLVTVRRLDGPGALAKNVIELDAEASLAMRLYLRERSLLPGPLFLSLRGQLSAKSARRLARTGPSISKKEVNKWWELGI